MILECTYLSLIQLIGRLGGLSVSQHGGFWCHRELELKIKMSVKDVVANFCR